MDIQGHSSRKSTSTTLSIERGNKDIVFNRGIFDNVFEKDIRRIYLYKKAERISKALHLILPAFKEMPAVKDKVITLSIELIEAGVLPPLEARDRLTRTLLTLLSTLEIGKASGHLSPMNAGILKQEVENLLEEIAAYESPRVTLTEMPSLSRLSREVPVERKEASPSRTVEMSYIHPVAPSVLKPIQSPIQMVETDDNRKDAILEVLSSRGPSTIKDILLLVRGIGEKTLQRKLQSLVLEGVLERKGERRWTTYSIKTKFNK